MAVAPNPLRMAIDENLADAVAGAALCHEQLGLGSGHVVDDGLLETPYGARIELWLDRRHHVESLATGVLRKADRFSSRRMVRISSSPLSRYPRMFCTAPGSGQRCFAYITTGPWPTPGTPLVRYDHAVAAQDRNLRHGHSEVEGNFRTASITAIRLVLHRDATADDISIPRVAVHAQA